jgi:hypothetical protein
MHDHDSHSELPGSGFEPKSGPLTRKREEDHQPLIRFIAYRQPSAPRVYKPRQSIERLPGGQLDPSIFHAAAIGLHRGLVHVKVPPFPDHPDVAWRHRPLGDT